MRPRSQLLGATRQTRRGFVRLALGGAVGLAAGCAPTAAPAPTKPAASATAPASPAPSAPPATSGRPLDVVQRGNLRGITFAAAIAKARSYFEAEGIDDQETIFGSGAEQTQAMAAGQIEVAASSNTAAFFNAIARGLRQPFVLDNWHLEPDDHSYMVVIRPDLVDTIKQIADLKGRPNATSTPLRDGGSNFQAELMLRASGVGFDEVPWERLSFPDMLTAFANKSIDAAWMIEPFITLGKQRDLLAPWLSLGTYDPGAQIAGLVFSETFTKDRTDVARRWSVAYVRGLRDYDDFRNGKNREVIAPILAAHTGLAPEVIDQVGWAPLRPDGRLNVDSLMQQQRQLLDWGTIQQVLPAEQIVDHQFVEYAVQRLGPA
jgi:NitT/TauT family transport system substrate-binding protein